MKAKDFLIYLAYLAVLSTGIYFAVKEWNWYITIFLLVVLGFVTAHLIQYVRRNRRTN